MPTRATSCISSFPRRAARRWQRRRAHGLKMLKASGLLDFHGNNVPQVGFTHPRVIAAIKQHLEELSFCTGQYTCAPAVQVAGRLAEIAPGDLNRVLFAPAGRGRAGVHGDWVRWFRRHKKVGILGQSDQPFPPRSRSPLQRLQQARRFAVGRLQFQRPARGDAGLVRPAEPRQNRRARIRDLR